MGLQPGRERPGDHPRPDDRRPVRWREGGSALQRTAAPGAERRLRGARDVHPLPQLPRCPGPVLRLLPHHADGRVRRPRYRPRGAPSRVPEHALVPRPPRRAHGRERVQGAARLRAPLQPIRHGRRAYRLPAPELSAVRHPARPHRQADRPRHGEDLLRPLRIRRPDRRQAAGQRRPPAVPRSAEAPLSLSGPGRRAVAILRAVPHQSGQPEAVDSVLRHRQRRQPPARPGTLPHVIGERGPHRLGVKRLWLENRLEQVNGRGPTGKILPAGQRENVLVEFRLVGNAVRDDSVDPADPTVRFYALPPRPTPRITRRFRFERGNGQWQVNGRFMDCDEIRFTVNRNSAERWILENNSGGWQHPIHIHLEEFQIVRRNGQLIPRGDIEFSRKDVVRLQFNEKIELVMRFRDFRGDYPMHCHNTIHEDHAMMLLWAVQDDANDNNTRP
ncbi:MAG: hypothetical protein E6J77_04735 [Deltaproteobacteria bacterium]|nr:MAG: hypothetical protein E6J77_04735 [Deltaproteobacteria bacterium]